ncbi:Sec-independent protein translocase protein TatB [Methylobacillus flagellatus]|uniref:Sec-independent protein translocase protein TatB n=1 Tax=Methylobacillus flagellatus TaxID=405 RepID=UPI0010F8301B|nr:Sec-independent protein translocase protein TatB [Methylobacillus flagellatus]
MFDIAFSELIVIALVALIVIGPERLPKVARMLGSVLGRMQRYVNTVKADIDRELQLQDLHKLQDEIQQSVREVKSGVQEVQTDLHQAAREAENSILGTAAINVPPSSGNPPALDAPPDSKP